jgi:hypothetical protein
MRSYTKVVKADNGEIVTATFAKDFGVSGEVFRWQHNRDQHALQLYNLLITSKYIYTFDDFPAGLIWNLNGMGQTGYSGPVWNGSSPVNVYSGASPDIVSLGYDIQPYDSHPLN